MKRNKNNTTSNNSNNNNYNNNSNNFSPTPKTDQTDLDIIGLLLQNHNNKKISTTLGIPLSTIQRRVRNLIGNEFIISKTELNYEKFGYKQGLIHIYLSDGNLEDILEKVSMLGGIISLDVHIGNSDILAGVVYKQGRELLKVITSIKRMGGIDRIIWSELVLEYPVKRNIMEEIL